MTDEKQTKDRSYKEIAEAYDEIVASTASSDEYYENTARRFGEVSGKLLDVGCGSGALLRVIHEHYPDLDLYGADVSRECAKSPKALAAVAVSPAEALPFADEAFDFITMSLVIEHCRDDVQALSEVYRCLRPGGRFFVSTDNRLWLQLMAFRNVFRRKENRYQRMGQVMDGDYTDGEFQGMLTQAGFTAIRRQASGPYPFLRWLFKKTPWLRVHLTKRLWYLCERPA